MERREVISKMKVGTHGALNAPSIPLKINGLDLVLLQAKLHEAVHALESIQTRYLVAVSFQFTQVTQAL